MAEEIALYGEVIVKRKDRDLLLKIRNGGYEFNELMQMIDNKMEHIKAAYDRTALPDRPDVQIAEEILVQIRDIFYSIQLGHQALDTFYCIENKPFDNNKITCLFVIYRYLLRYY